MLFSYVFRAHVPDSRRSFAWGAGVLPSITLRVYDSDDSDAVVTELSAFPSLSKQKTTLGDIQQ